MRRSLRGSLFVLLVLGAHGCEEAASEPSVSDTTGGSSGGDTDDPCPDVVEDGSFEMGPFTEAWTVESAAFESPICNAVCYVGVSRAFEGEWWLWFGGLPVLESASVSQRVPIIDGQAVLRFQLEIEAEVPNDMDALTVVVDGVGVRTIAASEAPNYEEYTEVAIDLGAYGDNKTHELSFDANFTSMTTTSFFVDAVELHTCP